MSNKYLKLFVDSLEKYQKLNDAEFGRLIRAALAYKANGEEVKLNGREDLLWDSMKLEIDRDNGAYEALCSVRSEAGKKGADVRWQNDSKNSKCHLPYGKEWQKCQDKEEDKDKDKDKEYIIPPIVPPSGGESVGKETYSESFNRFWNVYPNKVGKLAAYKAFKKVRVSVEILIEAVERQISSDQWKRDNGRYIPNPATWLNQGRWDDVISQTYSAPVVKGHADDDFDPDAIDSVSITLR